MTSNNHRQICDKIMNLAGKNQAEVLIQEHESALTRFADSVISQNVSGRGMDIGIRLINGGKVACASVSNADDRQLRAAVKSAEETLKSQRPDKNMLPLASPRKIPAGINLFDPKTASFSPADRAGVVAGLVKKAAAKKQTASGTVSNGWAAITLANSKGLYASHSTSKVEFEVTAKKGEAMGWAYGAVNNLKDMDFDAIGGRAITKAGMSVNPKAVEPGHYDVILEPGALIELFGYSLFLGFASQMVQTGQSYFSGKLGKKVFGDNISLYDNALDGPTAGMPFDYEGTPKKKLTLVENGILKNFVYDRKSASGAKTETTGHSLPQPNSYGAIPLNVSMKPGTSSLEEMIRDTRRGILVTQFHYLNAVDHAKMIMTGMTRNGTFIVENGKIAAPIKNMRFTVSVPEIFRNVEALGSEGVPFIDMWGSLCVPAMKIRNFNFSSGTKF